MSFVESMKTSSIKLYWHLTAYVPRKLPKDQAEYAAFCETLEQYFGIRNSYDVWMTVAGQVTSTPPNCLRKSYGSIANAAKRLYINKVAHDQKLIAIEALNVILEQKAKELADIEATQITQKAQDNEACVAPV